jgi:outer membrane protein assembly factor BamB
MGHAADARMEGLGAVERMSLEKIRQAVLRSALSRRRDGSVLISRGGRLQNWLLDLRPLFLNQGILSEIASLFWERYRGRERLQIGGIETAGIPLLIALLMSAPDERAAVNGFIVRRQRKTTGRANAIEGVMTDEPIVLVDDIFNSGDSVEKARVIVEMHGYRVEELFVAVDFGSQKGNAWRQTHRIKVESLFTLSDFSLEVRKRAPSKMQRYRKLWQVAIPGGYPYFVVPKSTPLFVDGRIYRGCDSGKMHAFDANTGAVVWEYQATGTAPRKGIWSSPAIDDRRLYFGAYNGCAYCLNADDGSEFWSQAYGEWVGASPLVIPRHGLVCFGIEYERPWARGSIGALSSASGEKVWEYLTKGLQHGSPAYWKAGDLVIWGTADHEMAALDARTGHMRWVFRTGRSVKYAPAVSEERGIVAFASFDRSIYVLDAATGDKRGEWQTGDVCYSTPLICGNRLFCGSGDRHLYVVDLDQMELLERMDLGARIYSSPRLVGPRVVVGTSGGRVFEIDRETLEVRGKLQLPDAITNAIAVSPDGGRIFVSTYMNHLYAFERLET